MTNETLPPVNENKTTPFGSRLRSAREALGLERKDAAAQLRLNEKIIVMLEKDKYPSDLPITFIRGYIRAYGKLLQIPETEIKKAIEPIQPSPLELETPPPITKPIMLPSVSSGDYFMQIFTYLIIFTLIGLVGMWWYSHSNSTAATPAIEAQVPGTQPSTATVTTPETGSAATQGTAPATSPSTQPVPPNGNQANTTAIPAPVADGAQEKPVSADQSKVTADASSATKPNEGTSAGQTKEQQAAQDDDDAADEDDSNANQSDDTEANSDNAD